MVIYYSAHIFGCLLWVITRYELVDTWWQADGLEKEDIGSVYLASLYWATTTITTVGYGDIKPLNDLERVIACFTMVCGTTMFSYVIGSVSSIVRQVKERVLPQSKKIGGLRRCVPRLMPAPPFFFILQQSVKSHMTFVMNWRSACNEEHILQQMAPNLRARVLKHVHHEAIVTIPIFTNQSNGFVTAILRYLRPQLH
ncbi:unnamed protein product, partial [Discosporangium mesarthrocarpum]